MVVIFIIFRKMLPLYIMENYPVYERDGNTVLKELETNDKINVGDTIEYISNNQDGYEKYRVIDNDGKKDIELIADYE